MLDIRRLREQPDELKKSLALKGVPASAVDAVLALDEERRALTARADELKAKRNERSKAIGGMIQRGEDPASAKEEVRAWGEDIAGLDKKLSDVDARQRHELLCLPNPPHPDVPQGGPDKNRIVREWGSKPEFSFTPKKQADLGEALGILDMAAGAKLSGSGFSLLWGQGAALQRGLIRFMLELHTSRHGYKECYPPFLVTRETMTGTGQLPKHEEDMYGTSIKEDNLFLIPTAEVPVTNIHAGDVLDGAKLPIKYCAYTPCFRREAGSYGKDTGGLLRLHQFDKVELVHFTPPDQSEAAHEVLTGHAEAVLQALGLHYRVLELASGDMSAGARRCYDIEVWAPGTGKYLEVSSCSNFGDYQARRANIRYRPTPKDKPEFVHTLNGSGVALPRLMIAILETYQQADGSVRIPEAAQSHAGFADIRKA